LVLIAREVRIGPGQTALTVIPTGARSKASDLVKPTIAAFEAAQLNLADPSVFSGPVALRVAPPG